MTSVIVDHRRKVQFDLFGTLSPALNPDGSVKGCKTIYAPQGQAGEYAALACNPYIRCGHSCSYPYYVPEFTHQSLAEFNAGAVLRSDFIANLRKDAAKY